MNGIHLISLGCSKNLVDSEHILGLLANEGFRYQAEAKGAEAVVVNTCGFLQAAVNESIETIEEMLELKRQGDIKHVIVTGCLSQRYGSDLEERLADVDLFLGTGNFHRIATYFRELRKNRHQTAVQTKITDPDYIYDHDTPRLRATMPHTAYVKVSEGCSRKCTFCIIPQLRGAMRSRTIESLGLEVEGLVKNGAKEINLIAQDLTAYGKDLKHKPRLADMLKHLVTIDGLEWIRLHYAYPHGFDDDLITVLQNENKVCSYLDMPLQHIDPTLLKTMRRQTTAPAILELLAKLKQRIDQLTLRTTLIVGFPGETDAAFNRLCQFVKDQRFDRLGVFTYSREPGTPAATMPNQIDEDIKLQRQEKIMRLQQRISLDNHSRKVGQTMDAIVDHIGEKASDSATTQTYVGRLKNQAPEVDGRAIIQSTKPLGAGSIIPVCIEGASAYDFYATAS